MRLNAGASGPCADALVPLPLPGDPHDTATVIETRLYAALEALGVRYEAQAYFHPYTADAFLPDYNLVLEADGCTFHACALCGYVEGMEDEANVVYARRARRDVRLVRWYHVRAVVHIWGHNLQTDNDALLNVRLALRPYTLAADYEDAWASTMSLTIETSAQRRHDDEQPDPEQ